MIAIFDDFYLDGVNTSYLVVGVYKRAHKFSDADCVGASTRKEKDYYVKAMRESGRYKCVDYVEVGV